MRHVAIGVAVLLLSGSSCTSPTGPSPSLPEPSGGAALGDCDIVAGCHDGQVAYIVVCKEGQVLPSFDETFSGCLSH